MLASLSVRDVVLIDRLDLEFAPGLGVLTGETGAGKSILLDSLGLALGGRAEARLLRRGAEQASVTAAFELPAGHPAFDLLRDQDLLEDGEALLLRRTLGQDGRTKAYVNDRPVSVGLLRDLGDLLVEIQGQFEQRGLLDSGTHRALLDAYGDLGAKAEETRRLHRSWQELQAERSEAEVALAQAKADEDYLRHAVAELNDLDPQPGEEERLAEQRTILMHAEKVGEAIAEAIAELDGSASEGARGADSAVGGALRVLERMADKAGGRLDPVIESLNRANAEIEEASATLASLTGDMDMEPGRLAEIEERYFALKDLARKHGVEVESLAPLRDEGVLIVGSGNTYHNMAVMMRAMRGGARGPIAGTDFDHWLTDAVTQDDPTRRDAMLANWAQAPGARNANPREEHLIPLHVVAGAAGADRGTKTLEDHVMGAVESAFRFG